MCYWTDINLSGVKFPSQKQLAIGIALLTTSSDNSRNYQKNVLSGAWICYITKQNFITLIYLLIFWIWKFQKISEQQLLQPKTKLYGIYNMTWKKSFDLWFLYPDVTVAQIQLSEKVSKNSYLWKASVGELHNGIGGYCQRGFFL